MKALSNPSAPALGAIAALVGLSTWALPASADTLTGLVTTAKPPATAKLKVVQDHKVCGKDKINESLIVNDGKLENAVVYIEDAPFDGKLETRSIKLDQQKCRFEPHVQAVTRESKLELLNNDGVMHNVHAFITKRGKNKKSLFNLAMPTKDVTIAKKLKKSGLVSFQCDAGHVWMSAYIQVFSHPYFAVTGSDGKFSIDVPAGTYKVTVWHETLGEKTQTVTVKGASKADFSF